jgi:hypothetical protein
MASGLQREYSPPRVPYGRLGYQSHAGMAPSPLRRGTRKEMMLPVQTPALRLPRLMRWRPVLVFFVLLCGSGHDVFEHPATLTAHAHTIVIQVEQPFEGSGPEWLPSAHSDVGHRDGHTSDPSAADLAASCPDIAAVPSLSTLDLGGALSPAPSSAGYDLLRTVSLPAVAPHPQLPRVSLQAVLQVFLN